MRSFVFIISLLFTSCLSEEITSFSPEQVTLLLATDSFKSWVLTERTIGNSTDLLPCETDDILVMLNPAELQDTTTLRFITGNNQCPDQPDSIIYEGYWEALDSLNSSYLLWIIDGDTCFRTVENITSQFLRFSYQKSGVNITEDFIILDN